MQSYALIDDALSKREIFVFLFISHCQQTKKEKLSEEEKKTNSLLK